MGRRLETSFFAKVWRQGNRYVIKIPNDQVKYYDLHKHLVRVELEVVD